MAIKTVRENMKITEHDALTNVTTDREMNASELEQIQADKIQADNLKTSAAEKATAKAALLEKLGITADEAALLLS